jgi:short-subunit dehydrogenase
MKIRGSVALVTGANRGLGQALVSALVEAGAAKVYAAARDITKVSPVTSCVVPLALDTTNAEQIAAAARAAQDVMLLINNAGLASSHNVLTASPAEIDADFRTNVHGTLAVIKAFLPVLERARAGATIVNVLSLVSLGSFPVLGGYSASKAAAYSITQALRRGSKASASTSSRRFPARSTPTWSGTSRCRRRARPTWRRRCSPASSVAKRRSSPTLWRSRWVPSGTRATKSSSAPSRISESTTHELTERVMKNQNFTTTILVDQTPQEVFEAVNDVRGWWSGEIDGRTDALGAEFEYRYKDVHRTTQRITEFAPGQRVVWHVVDSHINFVEDASEWNDTDIVFDIAKKGDKTELRFTHVGLRPAIACYGQCAEGWSFYINESLHAFITNGKGRPNRKEGRRDARPQDARR